MKFRENAMRKVCLIMLLIMSLVACSACVRNSAETKAESDPFKPLPIELSTKQSLLRKYPAPSAISLTVMKQTHSNENPLNYPVSLASSDDGSFYISDNNGHAVFYISSDLASVKKVSDKNGERQLQYPNTVQMQQDKLFVSDNDGIKVFTPDGSLQKTLRSFYAYFHFTVDSTESIFLNPILLNPKETDPLIVKLDKEGSRISGFGQRLNRLDHNNLEDEAYLCEVSGKVIAAFKHRPLIQIYDGNTGELVHEFSVTHPIFDDLKKLGEDKDFIHPKEGVLLLPRYIGGVRATLDRIFVLLYLPQAEILELNFQGQEIARYRATEQVAASDYFGFDVRSIGDKHQFTVGSIDTLHVPTLAVFSDATSQNQQTKEGSK